MSDDLVIERCRSCKGDAPLDERGYIVEHDWGRNALADEYVALPRGTGAYRCDGSGKRSLEFRDRKREAKVARHAEKVSMVRTDALVAYDAWCEGRVGFNYEVFLELAIKEHQLKFPGAITERRNRNKPYMTERTKGGDWKNYRKDIYCTFCRGILAARVHVNADPEAFPIVKTHPIGCAIQCLAGVREMVSPDYYGLIDEDRAFADQPGDL